MSSTRYLLFISAIAVYLVGSTEFMLSAIMSPLAVVFGVVPEQVSWLISVYAVAYTLAAPIVGYISDRIDKRKILLTSILLLSLDSFAIVLSPNFSVALILRILGGLASAALVPIIFSLVADVIKSDNQASAMGIVMMGMTLGIITGPILAGGLVQYFSWYAPFLLTAIVGLLVFSVAWFILPSSRSSHIPQRSFNCLKQVNIFSLILAKGMWNGVSVSLFLLAGEILRHRTTLATAEVGSFMGLFGIGILLGNVFVARVTAFKMQDAIKLILILLVTFTVLILFISGKLGLIGHGVCLLLLGLTLGLASPISTSLLARQSTSDKGLVLSVSESVNNLVLLSLLPVLSYLIAKNLFGGLQLIVIAMLCSAITLIVISIKFNKH
ncbi:MFS transporter [Providencia sp. Me31A]|uniref:MFS transporter n=1 Tax=Providencia sp. Me31A TaxID=3392637 RepID=UPI003D2AC746